MVDAEGAGHLELLAAVAARQEPHSQRPGAAGGEHIPDAVPHDDGVGAGSPRSLGGGEEEVGIGRLIPSTRRGRSSDLGVRSNRPSISPLVGVRPPLGGVPALGFPADLLWCG